MLNRNHGGSEEAITGVVIDLFASKRDRLRQKFGTLHPTLQVREPETTLATVTPITAGRRWHRSGSD